MAVKTFTTLYILLFLPIIRCSNMIDMKIVDDVSNYGWASQAGPDNTKRLEPKVKPSNFSGPDHFKYLRDKCFTLLLPDYRYELCFFNNVTQHERTLRWNPYSGILGIWTDWNIANYSFVGMTMKNGDDCGDNNREVEVTFTCSNVNNLTSVAEPSQCRYHMVFATPLVCHEDSMLVYPTLSEKQQKEWVQIEQDFYDGITTKQGYNYDLTNFFYKIGLKSTPAKEVEEFQEFKDIEMCNAKYIELLKENERLKKLLKSNERK